MNIDWKRRPDRSIDLVATYETTAPRPYDVTARAHLTMIEGMSRIYSRQTAALALQLAIYIAHQEAIQRTPW